MRPVRLVLLVLSVLASGGTFSALATIANAEGPCQVACQGNDDGCAPLCPGCTCGHVASFVDAPSPGCELAYPAADGRRMLNPDDVLPEDAPGRRLFEPPRA